MTKLSNLQEKIVTELGSLITSINPAYDEITMETTVDHVKIVLLQLRDNSAFHFEQLMDLCAIDYLHYGQYDWETETTTEHGFSRGVEPQEAKAFSFTKPRFAVVYHLLSLKHNVRLRLKVFVEEANLIVPSVYEIYKSANWFEREAYDLYGILFDGHPDLRRILTDYGFIGHPFRKDFPISGHVEMRYDAQLQKVIYEPVTIQPRVLVPKVIRDDNRYLDPTKATEEG